MKGNPTRGSVDERVTAAPRESQGAKIPGRSRPELQIAISTARAVVKNLQELIDINELLEKTYVDRIAEDRAYMKTKDFDLVRDAYGPRTEARIATTELELGRVREKLVEYRQRKKDNEGELKRAEGELEQLGD